MFISERGCWFWAPFFPLHQNLLHKFELIHRTVYNLTNVNEANADITYEYLIKAYVLQPLCFSYGDNNFVLISFWYTIFQTHFILSEFIRPTPLISHISHHVAVYQTPKMYLFEYDEYECFSYIFVSLNFVM